MQEGKIFSLDDFLFLLGQESVKTMRTKDLHSWNLSYSRARDCQNGLASKVRFTPLKKQPDSTFSEITRAQALDEIAEKIDQLRQSHGARSIGVWKGEALGFQQQEQFVRRFAHALGSPNYFSK